MHRYFLRVEGVNHANVIDDTDDLSTRRGGGLMLLNAPEQMVAESTLGQSMRDRLRPISVGASIGLFEFDAADEDDAQKLAADVREHFRTGTLEYEDRDKGGWSHLSLTHGTFVVDISRVGEDDHAAEQLVTAKNRWQQMRSLSLSVEGVWDRTDDPCEYDMIRPAAGPIPAPDRPRVSRSVAARWTYGRHAKQQFYRRELAAFGPYPGYEFTHTFQDIATHPDGEANRLHNKLAVFYVDGNKFGEHGRSIFRDKRAAGFKDWSDAIRRHHRERLRDLLKIAAGDEGWQTAGDDPRAIRLETLIWGGDEILFVVPAWKGWELVKWFFDAAHMIQTQSVTYSGGLVFCNVKAPIQNVIDLSKRLGDLAKQAKGGHRLAYEVMESFDDIPGGEDELTAYRQRWLPKDWDVSRLVLDPRALAGCWPAVTKLADCTEFPTRQLYRLCKQWREGSDDEASENRLKADELKAPVEEVLAAFGGQKVGYLHLLQILPYIPTPAPAKSS